MYQPIVFDVSLAVAIILAAGAITILVRDVRLLMKRTLSLSEGLSFLLDAQRTLEASERKRLLGLQKLGSDIG